jgi:hypothetical protein
MNLNIFFLKFGQSLNFFTKTTPGIDSFRDRGSKLDLKDTFSNQFILCATWIDLQLIMIRQLTCYKFLSAYISLGGVQIIGGVHNPRVLL